MDENSKEFVKIKEQSIDKYGLETRRYARKQRRWLKNRISNPALGLNIFRFDTSGILFLCVFFVCFFCVFYLFQTNSKIRLFFVWLSFVSLLWNLVL